MGNIPIQTQQIGPGLGTVMQAPRNRSGGFAGQLIEQESSKAEEFLTKIAEQDAAIEGANLLSKFRVDAEAARERLQSTVQTPDNFTDVALKEFDKMSGDFLKNVQNKRAVSFVEQRLIDVRSQYAMNSLQWETNARSARRALMVEDTLNQMGARVLKNPGDYDGALKEWDDAITASGVPIDVADKMRRNGKDQLAVSLAQGMIRRNPFQALQSLQTDARFTTLDPDKLESLIRSSESAIQHKAAMADHAANQSLRARKEMGEQAAKDGFDLLAKGQLTEEWMTQNKRMLDTSDYRMLRDSMQEGGSPSSKDTLIDLTAKVYTGGSDASDDILSAWKRGDIKASEAKSLLNENKDVSPVKRAKVFLSTALKPSDVNPNPAHAQAYAEAMSEFDRLWAENPKQDPDALARIVLKRNSLIDTQSLTITRRLPSPKFIVGDRNSLDTKTTERNIVAYFTKKHGNDKAKVKADPEFRREMQILQEWKSDQERQARINAAAKGGTQ